MRSKLLLGAFLFGVVSTVLGQMDVSYNYPFDSNIEGWWPEEVNEEKGIEYRVANGTYQIHISEPNTFAYTSANIKIYAGEDFTVTCESQCLGGESTSNYGLGLRSNKANDLVALYVNGSGEFCVRYWAQARGGWSFLKEWTKSKAVKTKKKNKLTISNTLGKAKFFVNGESVFQINLIDHPFDYVNLLARGVGVHQTDYVNIEIPGRDINLLPGWETIPEADRLSRNINSVEDESSPFVSIDGDKMYVSRAYWIPTENGRLGLIDTTYISYKEGDDWSKLEKLGKPFNIDYASPYNTFPDGNTFLASRQNEPGKLPLFEFCLSRKTQNGWGDLELMEVKNLENYLVGDQFDGFVCADGKTIIFTLSADTANSLTYLYVSFQQDDGTWSEPKSMGKEINKVGYRQGTAFLAADMTTLFFASNGHIGYGGFDLFMSKRLDDTWTNWSEPYNLGPNINTQGSEMYFSIPASGDYGLFVMDKASYGERDVWKLDLPPALKPDPVLLVKGHVYENGTENPLSAKVTVKDLTSNKEVGVSWTDPSTGDFEIILQKGHNYSFHADKDNYFPTIEKLDLSGLLEYEEYTQDLFLSKMEKGAKIQLKNLLFVQSKAEMLPESMQELEHLLDILQKNEELKILIEGHTDNTGSRQLNYELSQARADVVRDYLIDHGVKRSRLKAAGRGSSQPLVDNRSEENRQLNRRVEFSVVE